MFQTRTRKIIRDILARRARTALVAMSIFIGVLGVVTIWGSGDILISQILSDLREEDLAMQQLFVVNPQDQPIEDPSAQLDNLLAELQSQNTGILALEGRATYNLQWRADGDSFNNGFIRAFSKPFDELQMDPMRLTDGRYPEAGKQELAIEQRLADKYELAVGDTLELRIASQSSGDGTIPVETWTIVGVVLHPYADFTGGLLTPQSESIYTTYDDAQYIAGFNGYSALYTRYETFAMAKVQSDHFIATMRANTPYVEVFNFMEDPAENTFIEFSRQYIQVFNSLGILAMLVSGFLVVNVINSMVIEQKRQIGVMKSLGASAGETFSIYAGIALVYGLIAVIPGVLLGIPAGDWLAKQIAPLANSYIQGFKISVEAIVLGLVMGIGVPILAAVVPVLIGTRVSILNALTDLGISSTYGSGPVARFIGRLPLPISAKQALSNVWQKRGRLILTGATLTLAIGAFMGVTAVFASVNTVISDAFDTFDYEIAVSPNRGHSPEAIETALADLNTVETVYPGVGLAVKLPGYEDPQLQTDQVFVVGIDPTADMVRLNLKEGLAWQNDPTRDGIVLTFGVADKMSAEVGDLIDIVVGGQTRQIEVIGIDNFPFDQAFMRWEQLATLSGFTDDTTGEILPNAYYLKLKDGDELSAGDVEKTINTLRDTLLARGIPAKFSNQVQLEEENAQQILSIGLIFNIAAIVMALVGAIGLLTTLSMAVYERQKEIGVMRSIGANSLSITSQFLTEGIMVSLLAWIIGVPLSYLISLGLMETLPIGNFFEFEYPVWVLPVGLVGIMVVALIASTWPSVAAARKTVSEILRYQ